MTVRHSMIESRNSLQYIQMVQKSKAIEVTERLRNRAINQGWKCPVPDQFLLSMASKGDKRIREIIH